MGGLRLWHLLLPFCLPPAKAGQIQQVSMLGWAAVPKGEAPSSVAMRTLHVQVTPTPRPGDEHAEKRKALRAGYVGHLTQISNRLLQLASEGNEQVRCLRKWLSCMQLFYTVWSGMAHLLGVDPFPSRLMVSLIDGQLLLLFLLLHP